MHLPLNFATVEFLSENQFLCVEPWECLRLRKLIGFFLSCVFCIFLHLISYRELSFYILRYDLNVMHLPWNFAAVVSLIENLFVCVEPWEWLRLRKLIEIFWSCVVCIFSALIFISWTLYLHFLQGNFCQHFYVANCCVVEPSEWEGYSSTPDQTLWASTVRLLMVFIFFQQLLVIHSLTDKINKIAPCRNPIPHQPFHFTSREFITYSSVRWERRSGKTLLSWVGGKHAACSNRIIIKTVRINL